MAETKTKSAAATKPAAKSATTKPASATKATKPATPKKATARKEAAAPKITLSPEERYVWIQNRAYFIAEADGFRGDPKDYWAQAEVYITRMLEEG
ncbi:MAG: DUF2934 domain-containing protein [Methylophilaceae bacterium]|nr:DUF2934 domain-containing protein [Methylophilaceae bacterium]